MSQQSTKHTMEKVTNMPAGNNDVPNIMVVAFSDVEIPEFKEVRNKDYIFYGKNNLYPQYLTYLYNKSAKHGAIVNGKAKYVFGGGLVGATADELAKLPAINRDGETWNDIGKKALLDNELYGGHYLMVIWNLIGSKPADIFHIEFEKLRADKAGGYWYKYNWADNKEEPVHYKEFDPENRRGVQIFAYKEYRPGTSVYPLPEYLPCNNYIETDIEISKFHLSSIRNGMMPSKAIEFFIGDPPDEKKREIEKRFEKKFSGAENAGKFVMIFNTSKDKSVNITDLSASELDKQFDILNKTCQQEIFTGHQVTSPMLFGIKEEGQLGGATELATAYQIFVSNYAKPKRLDFEVEVNYFQSLLGLPTDLYLKDAPPIGTQIDVKDVIQSLPKEYVFKALNIPEADWSKPTIGDSQADPAFTPFTQASRFAADDQAIGLFSAVGELKSDYLIVKKKKVLFSSNEECAHDEDEFWEKERQRQSFLDSTISNSEASILDLIKKDKRITADVIASVLDSTAEWVATKIASLEKRGYLSTETLTVGSDTQTSRTVLMPIDDIRNDRGTPDTTQIFIKYSYEGPKDDRNRDFCAKMLDLNRLYSRYEIEQISQQLGYSVFDRRGGFWRHPDGITTPYCRHKWQSNIVVKKGVNV